MIYSLLVGASLAFAPPAHIAGNSVVYHRAVSPVAIASTPEERAVLAASRKVTSIASRFGFAQGKAAQKWVEEAVKTGGTTSDVLMEMQLELFNECTLDDDSGRCKALSEAIDTMKAAVETKAPLTAAEKKSSPKAFNIVKGKTPIQEAATKVREAASRFGPAQKAAANDWIKMVTLGTEAGAVTSGFRESLLAQKITLFGECILSEDGSPSDCEQLENALAALQETIELCETAEKAAANPPAPTAAPAGAVTSWFDAGMRLDGTTVAPTKAASKGVVAPTAPAAKEATPTADEAVEGLKTALRQATVGRDARSKSALDALSGVVVRATAAGVDKEKLRVAQAVLDAKGKAPDAAARFW